MNNNYNILIIDDEPIAIDVISNYLERLTNCTIVGSFTNALEALPVLYSTQIDLIFLDIEMPGISGIDFLKSIQTPPYVIFTTAYRNYAVEAFDLEVVDYLLKPISFDRFLKAINRFYALNDKHTASSKSSAVSEIIELKADKKIHKINKSDILYIESVDDYVKVHTGKQRILTYQRMHQMEELLSEANFIRVHRSFIVNRDAVTAYSTSHIEIGKTKISIGRTYREKVTEKL